MNKDQLLDAIGMVDEKKIRDAAMIKRTKWLSGILAALVVLFVLVLPTLAFYLIGFAAAESEYDYSLYALTSDIDSSITVTVYEDYQDRYTIEVPDNIHEAMRFDEWIYTPDVDLTDRKLLFTLRFPYAELQFYEGGYVRAEKHDWNTFIGIYAVPDELWKELKVFLAK